jgi:hypothetical protein
MTPNPRLGYKPKLFPLSVLELSPPEGFMPDRLSLKSMCTCAECIPDTSRLSRSELPESRGSVEFPLTERIASDVAAHGETWARNYHTARGVSDWEWEVLVRGARA